MDCERIEQLLPLYIDGDLPLEQAEEISGHLAACPECASSLAAYRELEDRLTSMPGLLPDPGVLASGLSARLGLKDRRSIAEIFRRFSIVWSISALTVSIMILLGRFDLSAFIASEHESIFTFLVKSADYWMKIAGGWIEGQIAVIVSMDPWMLASLMTGFSILVFTAGVTAAFRSIR